MDAKYDRIDGVFQQAAEAWYADKIKGTTLGSIKDVG